jgi:hypothetical protein
VRKLFKSKEEEDREKAADVVFSRPRKAVSDILPADRRGERVGVPEERPVAPRRPRRMPLERIEDEDEDDEDEAIEAIEQETYAWRHADEEGMAQEWRGPRKGSLPIKRVGMFLIGVAVIGGLIGLALVVLPRADITITLRRTPWEFSNTVNAFVTGGDIAAQLFTQTKNATQSYAASGKKYMETKAHGTIKIVNAYSSETQALVASTRFVTPDGKIFRLQNAVTVPGAKIVSGKIEPSSIDAQVIADKAGTEYNIGPTERFTIPGFQGTPKYDAFYGVSSQPMTGGNIGEAPYATPEDIEKAKAEAEKSIKDTLASAFAFQVPEGFSVLEGSENFAITKSTALPDVGEDGKFRYFVEAHDERLAVRESDILNFVQAKAIAELGQGFKESDHELSYRAQSSERKGTLLSGASVTIIYKGNYVRDIDTAAIAQGAAGKSEEELKNFVISTEGVEKAKVSLWPFWVMSVPTDTGKIKVILE